MKWRSEISPYQGSPSLDDKRFNRKSRVVPGGPDPDKTDDEKNVINAVILIAYLIIHIFLAVHHEAWRDESQAWVIARDSSFLEILGLCASEGHPCLWFYLLKICQILGLSFYHISIISIIILSLAAGILLWKSPFSMLANICILLSPVFFYYNPVICRIYPIVILLIIFLCVYWPERREKPIAYGSYRLRLKRMPGIFEKG